MRQKEADNLERGSADPEIAVIWLHGLGADGHDFAFLADVCDFGKPTRFWFPHAPYRPITVNAGTVMRAWYDIIQLGEGREDEAGIREAIAALHAQLDAVRARYPLARLFLGGFSQGGALALAAAMRYPHPLAGIIGLSTYLPMASQAAIEQDPANQQTPIFIAHGTMDPVLPYLFGTRSVERLSGWGYPVTFKSYWMMHQVLPQELEDVISWVQARL